ncbi:MAG: hypothetical protein VCC00_13845 [Deltaproteobacteria bacterium]
MMGLGLLLAATTASAEILAPEGHPFRVEVPGKAEHKEQSRSIGIGTVTSENFIINDDTNAIFVSIVTLPSFASVFTPTSVLYSQTRDGMLEDIGGDQLAFTDFERDGREGKLLIYEIPSAKGAKRHGRAEFFRFSRSIYLFAAHGIDEKKSLREKFFASLKILD